MSIKGLLLIEQPFFLEILMMRDDTITYPQLLQICGQGPKKVDELVTYLLHAKTGEDAKYSAEEAFKVVLGDVMLAIGVEQLAVVAFLTWVTDKLDDDVSALRLIAICCEEGKMTTRLPWLIIQILEGRWVIYPDLPVYDLEERESTIDQVLPTISTALNVTMLWMRTVPKCLGLDSVVERVQAGGLRPGSSTEQSL